MMKRISSRIFATSIVAALIISSALIVLYQVQKIQENEVEDDETKVFSNLEIKRVTRSGTSWPMHRADLLHSGFTTSSVPNNNSILWSNTTGNGDAYGSPVVEDGKVFVGSRDGYLYCFDLNTGDRLWRTFLSSGDYSISSTPAVANDHVVVFSAGDDAVYRLRVSDGGINWSFNPTGGGAYGGSSPAINNGRIYVGSGNGTFYCLNEITGGIIWSYTTGIGPVRPYGIQSSPAVANGRVFIGSCDTYLYCINETQPGPVADYFWRTNLFDAIFGSPAVANGRVYCGSGYYVYGEGTNSHTMFCLDELTGAPIWSYVTGSDILSSPAIAYGNCYFTSTDGKLYCVDAMSSGPTPTLYWSNTTGDTWSSPAVSDGKVVVGSRFPDIIYCFNATTGTLVWSYNVGNDIYSSPAIADGKVVVGVKGNPESVICFGSSVTPTIDNIKIVSDPGGTGSEIPNQFVDVGTVIPGYAAAYNGTDYLFDISVNWTVTNDSSTNASTNPTFFVNSSNFYSGFYGGTVVWTADDGNGHTVNVTFWVNPPDVDYIRIVSTEGTGSTEILDDIMDVGYTTLGYAASFNYTVDYIGDTPVTWSVINTSGAEGSTTPNFGTNSTVDVGLKGGNVEWIANDGSGHTDSVNFLVRDPEVDHIMIMTGPNGTGSWVGDSTFIYSNTTTFFAGGFNDTSGWVEDVPASWNSDNPFVGNVDPGPSNSTTFIALNNGTCNIIATYNTFSNTTGVLTIINYTVDFIRIGDAPNNGGSWVGDKTFGVGETVNFFAAAYNSSAPGDGYIGDVNVEWESSDPSIATVTTPGASTLFTAQFLSGECNVTARYGSLITNTTGRLTVLPADLDYIVITDAPNGNELITVYLNVGESIQIYASGYNSTGPTYVGLVNVDWTQAPLIIGSFSQSPGTSTSFTAGISGGSTIITATHTISAINDDFTLIINPPTVDYIQIRDAYGGLGNIVITRTYIVNETEGFYAAAYNSTASYLYDVFAMWSSNDTDVGQVTSQGIWTNFTAMHIDLDSICTVSATYNPLISNSTGSLTVLAPRVDYIQIRDEPGGKGNVSTTLIFTLGENITDTYYCAAYNHTIGYLGDRSAEWSVNGGIGTVVPGTGQFTVFTATTLGTGIIRANLTGIINSTGTITVIQVPDTTPPEAPTGLQVSQEEGGGALRLTWNENTEGDLAGYNIYRSLSEGSGFELINTEGLVTSISYLDTGLTNGTTYYYRITAVDEASNESPFSDMVHNTPIVDGEEDEEEFPILLILLPIIIVIVLILFILLFKRRKPEEAPLKPEIAKKELPPPPSWMVGKEEETTSGEKEEPPEDEIPEEKSPITEDEEISEDELPPPEDWEDELPRPDDEIPKDRLPPPNDE